MIRTYRDLSRLGTIEERYAYLKLSGRVGEATFGSDRWVNQKFYSSEEWGQIRSYVIVRDQGCDLGMFEFRIHKGLHIHHMNPMTLDQIRDGDESILDPEYLVTVSQRTHNAIHYGNEELLPRLPVVRRPGDTKLW
jgi:hypothetical protein